jgi:D-glycero-alpha-D-manno-heptose-7-phosphate kinase
MGGTVDLPAFHYALRHARPVTFNMALNLRTRVRISAWTPGMVRVSSKGFEPCEHPLDALPFRHPLGLVFSVASWFRASGAHIEIESASPPKSALGGSSAAAAAIIGAFSRAFSRAGAELMSRKTIVVLAHALESVCAGVPCGMQDHLAAAYGGVNAWEWPADPEGPPFERRVLLPVKDHPWLNERFVLAFCGRQHASADVNGIWVSRFLEGKDRDLWTRMCGLSRRFCGAVEARATAEAVSVMEEELGLRREMTPEVLDPAMRLVIDAARREGCGARFTGAGGGGCVWALGEPEAVRRTRSAWAGLLADISEGGLLEASVDGEGLAY